MGEGVSGLDFYFSIVLDNRHRGFRKALDTPSALEPSPFPGLPPKAQKNNGGIAACGS